MEWLLFVSALAVTVLMFLRTRRQFWKWTSAVALAGAGLTLLAAKLFADKTALKVEAREKFLETVKRQGYIDDYRGIRVSNKGRRFEIQKATVWNLLDGQGHYAGQAASFTLWKAMVPLPKVQP